MWELREAEARAGPWSGNIIRAAEEKDEQIGFYIVSHLINGWDLISHTKNEFVFRLTDPPSNWRGGTFHRFQRQPP